MYDAANLAAFLYRLKNHFKQNYEEIVDTIRLVAPYFSDFVLDPQEGNEEQIVLRWRQTGCEDIFNASQLSDGTLRFICLTTLLLQPHELQPATIIVDEPELGLHPYAITIFAEMVRQLSNEKQIIISTQSVELLNEFDVEDVIVVDRSDNGSEFRRLDSEQLKLWLDGDYTLGDLWKKNIWEVDSRNENDLYLLRRSQQKNPLLTLYCILTFSLWAFMYALLSVKQGEMPTGNIAAG